MEGLAGCPPCHGNAAAAVHAIIARGVLHYIGDVDAALARLAAVLQPGGILAIRDGVPMDHARFETMNDQLASAGAPTEPRNALDPQPAQPDSERAGPVRPRVARAPARRPSPGAWSLAIQNGRSPRAPATGQSSPENRSHAACFDTPSASPMRVQLIPRARKMSTRSCTAA